MTIKLQRTIYLLTFGHMLNLVCQIVLKSTETLPFNKGGILGPTEMAFLQGGCHRW